MDEELRKFDVTFEGRIRSSVYVEDEEDPEEAAKELAWEIAEDDVPGVFEITHVSEVDSP